MGKVINLPSSWKGEPAGGTTEDVMEGVEGVILLIAGAGMVWSAGRELFQILFGKEEETETLTPSQVLLILESYDGMGKKKRRKLKKKLRAMCRS